MFRICCKASSASEADDFVAAVRATTDEATAGSARRAAHARPLANIVKTKKSEMKGECVRV